MKRKKKNQISKIIKNQATRADLTKKSHLWFFHTYLSSFVQYKIAEFHKEMFAITERDDISLAAICSFRGSAKSTLMTLSYPIWAVVGRPQKKFVVLISQTAEQAKLHFKNLKRELETNDLLKRDLGPFQETDEWNNCSLVIPRYNAKIIAVSKDQSFRGIRHGRYRPDLIVADDVENTDSVKTQEARESTFNWLTSEVFPLGDKGTKIIIVGNLLHEDSLLKRLENLIVHEKLSGIFRKYPLLDEYDNITWPGKYEDLKAVEDERLRVGDEKTWNKEYLLHIIDDRERVITEDKIQYYDKLPEDLRNQSYSFATGIDLAISEKATADFTSLVSAKVIGSGDNFEVYILPNPVNARLKFTEILERAEDICKVHDGRFSNKFYVEDTMLQGYVTQQLRERNIDAVGVKIRGKDKRERLELAANKVYQSKVYFPRNGCEELIKQLVDFGRTRHDDMADAFSILILGLIEKLPSNCGVLFVETNGLISGTLGNRRGEDWGDKDDREMLGKLRRHPWGPGKSSSIEFGADGLIHRKY